VYWHPIVTVPDVARATAALRAAGSSAVSGDVVTLPQPTLRFVRTVMLRDPDGHALQLVER
jgi:hypothetical protein